MKSALMNELQAWGCDMDGAMARFLQKEDFYARCYKKFVDDASFEALGEALESKNADEAFRHAHSLKGLTANMGLTPLYELVVQIVEPLRAGNVTPELPALYEKLMSERKRYKILALRDGD